MNIHEHQAKDILREFGAPVSKGIVVFSVEEIKSVFFFFLKNSKNHIQNEII